MIRDNPSWMVFLGLGMVGVGVFLGCQAFQRGLSSEDDVAIARPLRPAQAPVARQPPASIASEWLACVVFGGLGAALSVYGTRLLKQESELLQKGVPATGLITDIGDVEDRPRPLRYRFMDADGVTREGAYYPSLADTLFESFQLGQEVTVLYDPVDSTRHVLDVDNVHARRAVAMGRRRRRY